MTATITSTMPVTTAPKPLMKALVFQPGSFVLPPVDDHAGLRQRERDEDADHVERQQQLRVAAEPDDQDRREDRQDEDAVREGEPVALVHELPRQVAVARDDRRQPREVGVRRVRRQHEDQHRRGLQQVVDDAAAERSRGPSCDTPDSAAVGTTPYACASTVMPTNMQIAITAIATSVADAFFASGGRKAGTPFDTASTPVIAVQPFAKAVSSRKIVSFEWPAFGRQDGLHRHDAAGRVFVEPASSSAAMLKTKKYVGTAKMLPDSRMPRRLPSIRIASAARHISTRKTSSFGKADVTARMPAEMLTDTVSV